MPKSYKNLIPATRAPITKPKLLSRKGSLTFLFFFNLPQKRKTAASDCTLRCIKLNCSLLSQTRLVMLKLGAFSPVSCSTGKKNTERHLVYWSVQHITNRRTGQLNGIPLLSLYTAQYTIQTHLNKQNNTD